MTEQGRFHQGDGEPEDQDGRGAFSGRPDAVGAGGGEDIGGGDSPAGVSDANDSAAGQHSGEGDAPDGAEAGGTWEPTAEPPAGVDVLVWRLAYQLYTEHRAHTDNFCMTCRQFWPCTVRRLAESALTNALDPGGRRHDGEPGPEATGR